MPDDRREEFLDEMSWVLPWLALVALIHPCGHGAHQEPCARSSIPDESILRMHGLQLWWNLSARSLKSSCTSVRCTAAPTA